MSSLFNVNGVVTDPGQPVFTAASRCYRYGDGFFESMRFSQGRILHGDLHFIRVRKSAMLLKMQLPESFDRDELEKRIQLTLGENPQAHCRVRCTFFRESAGLYTPLAASTSVVIEINHTENGNYEWNEEGLNLGAFKELSKNGNYISTLKTTSCLVQVMAGLYAAENKFDECLVYNDSGRVAEGIGSNIFAFNGEFLITPPLSEYCVDGVMRRVVFNLAQEYGYTCVEQPLSDISLNSAEEIFFTSATRGIRWVGVFNGKKYKNNVSRVLYDKLNHSQL